MPLSDTVLVLSGLAVLADAYPDVARRLSDASAERREQTLAEPACLTRTAVGRCRLLR